MKPLENGFIVFTFNIDMCNFLSELRQILHLLSLVHVQCGAHNNTKERHVCR